MKKHWIEQIFCDHEWTAEPRDVLYHVAEDTKDIMIKCRKCGKRKKYDIVI